MQIETMKKVNPLEYGTELLPKAPFKYDDKTYPPGKPLPYVEEGMDFDIIERLYYQGRLLRADALSPDQIRRIGLVKRPKIIRNFKNGRFAISWPDGEPLPEGVVCEDPEYVSPEELERDQSNQKEEVPQKNNKPLDDFGVKTDLMEDEGEAIVEEENIPVLHDRGEGYFDVLVGGEPQNKKPLKIKAAQKMMEKLTDERTV